MAQSGAQRQVAEIDRGLFLLRYAQADDDAAPPKVVVCAAPESDQDVGFILPPDTEEAVLWRPGSSLVIRATASGRLNVEVVPTQPKGSTAATIKIEPLHTGSPPAASAGRGLDDSAADIEGLRVLGHVAGIGDVVVGANEWIAGPSAPSRIEGIALECPAMPAGLEIRYSVKLGGPQAPASKLVSAGTFAGTRGRALPITGVVLELSGPSSAAYEYAVEAVFLGSPIRRGTGKRVVLSGPTGREPMVGLRVNLEPVAKATRPAAAAAVTPSPSHPIEHAPRQASSGRVRVFRGRAKQD